ncbi:MAG: elongation factor G [Cyanobacteria bacterium NC_groundwater_1444_Ag_S-0.65um_54_12]|nr:elongation factor G [Cyanobacteria bacterium NC_groundwater_1444_Ag_S-0.65um_54_12]
MDLSKIRNLVLLGAGAAGKTTLIESLLFAMGATTAKGSVEQGNTVTDFDEEEIRRQQSISTAWASAAYQGFEVNLIDTPGYSDFQIDMRYGLLAGDAVLQVIDATRGVDATSRKLYALARERGLPVIIFVNKLESEKANDYEEILKAIKENLSVHAAPFAYPDGIGLSYKGVIDLIKPQEVPAELKERVAKAHTALVESVAELDEALMNKYFEDGTLSAEDMAVNLRKGVASSSIIPVFCGSAKDGGGVTELLGSLLAYSPAPLDRGGLLAKDLDSDSRIEFVADHGKPFAAIVFKTIADPFVGKISIFRVISGELKQDDQVRNSQRNATERVGRLFKMLGKKQNPAERMVAGQIGAVAKLKETLTGDTLVAGSRNLAFELPPMPMPIFSIAIAPKAKGEETKLAEALRRIEEEDPSLSHSAEAATHRTVLQGVGQNHLDVTIERLRSRFHLDVAAFEPKIPYRETVTTHAEGQGRHKKQTGGRGQFGDCWLKIDPLPRGTGFKFVDEIKGGVIPNQYIPAVEKGVREILEEGILAGYLIVDVQVTVFFGSYHTVDSSEMAFKIAAHLAMKKIFPEAKPLLLEPILSVIITVPDESVGDTMSDLNTRRAQVEGMDGGTVRCKMPMAELAGFLQSLKSYTKGQGTAEAAFSHYQEVPGNLQQKIIEEARKEREAELAAK